MAINLIKGNTMINTWDHVDPGTSTYWRPGDPLTYTLYTRGCIVENLDFNNCTAACANKDLAFANVYTYLNCAIYLQISQFITEGNLIPAAQDIADEFHILNSSASTSTIYNVQQACLTQWVALNNESDYAEIVTPFCYHTKVPGTINTDVGGIGVLSISPLT